MACEQTRESRENPQALFPRFRALVSFRVPLTQDFSRRPQMESLLAR